MKVVDVTTAKRQHRRILADIRHGASYVIVEHNLAVARIQTIPTAEGLNALETTGVVVSPQKALVFDEFRSMRRPRLAHHHAVNTNATLTSRAIRCMIG